MAEPAYTTRRWLAFYVKPRHEKKVSERVRSSGVEVFCPLVTVRVRWSDRWKKIQKPLINGYLFAHVNEFERRKVLIDPAIWRTVFWKGHPALIRDEEIEVMRHLIKAAENVEIESIRPGDRVKVTEGGYVLGITGLEGIVVKIKGNQISIRLESLQAQLSVTVPGHMLRCFDPVESVSDIYI